jgi:hypothetical protein
MEQQQFGKDGFGDALRRVERIEGSFALTLAAFTAPRSQQTP